MADTGKRPGRASLEAPGYEDSGPSAWTGWIIFAAVIMVMIGSFHVIAGIVALFEDDYYAVRPSGLVINVDYTAWGWTHLLFGFLVVAAGFGALLGQIWARAVAVLLAVLSAVVNMVFIAAYPIWSIMIIALDVIVIYSLIVHGRELNEE